MINYIVKKLKMKKKNVNYDKTKDNNQPYIRFKSSIN